MAAITSVNAAEAITKVVSVRALASLKTFMVMGGLVNRNYEPELARDGDTINIPVPVPMSSNNLAEGGTVQTQNPSLGNAQVVLNTHQESSFSIPDVTKALAAPEIMNMYLEEAVIAVAEKIEGDLFGLFVNLTDNTAVNAYNTALTEAHLDSAETVLFKAKVPQSTPKFLVLDPDAYAEVRQLTRFTEQQTIGSGQPIATGLMGTIKSFQVFRSQNVKVASGTDVSNLAFARDAFALVIRPLEAAAPGLGVIQSPQTADNFALRVTMSYTPATLSQQMTIDVLYGTAVLRNPFGVEVRN